MPRITVASPRREVFFAALAAHMGAAGQHQLVSDAYKEQYRFDPVGWNRDCIIGGDDPLKAGLTDYQEQVMADLVRYGRVELRGPHTIGKTALEARTVLWFATTRDGEDWKVPTTASSWQQLTRFLWPEIRKWAGQIRWDRIGRLRPFKPGSELLQLNLKLTTGEAFAIASDKPEHMEGAHADHLLYIMDEAKAIKPGTFEAVEGAFAGAGPDTPGREAYALVCSTPGEPNGYFYDIARHAPGTEDWHTVHVTKAMAIDSGRMSEQWADARRRQWGEHSAVYQNRVEGAFASEEKDVVIPLEWVDLAVERWWTWVEGLLETRIEADDRREWERWAELALDKLRYIHTIGVDVAYGGEAKTVLAPTHGPMVVTLRKYSYTTTTVTTSYVIGLLDRFAMQRGLGIGQPWPIVDVIGYGAGVVDGLRAAGHQVAAFVASKAGHGKDRSGEMGFVNMRSKAWWSLRERLDPSHDPVVGLPPDEDLIGDLTAPRYTVKSGARYQIEAKEKIRERIGRSTDSGDAVVQALSDPMESDVRELDSDLVDELSNWRGI